MDIIFLVFLLIGLVSGFYLCKLQNKSQLNVLNERIFNKDEKIAEQELHISSLSNKNEKIVEMANASGQLNINKSFKLAAVFNSYILIYGLPEYGIGFDPIKIAFLVDLLKKKGIDPYK